MNIFITMSDGTKREFKDYGRSGGSYSQQLELKGDFVIITDCYGEVTAIHSSGVKEIKTSRP